jgi:lysophospholipase L1-like esterase
MLGQAIFLCGLVVAELGVTPLAKDEPKVSRPNPNAPASAASERATLAAATDKRQEATTVIACDHADFGLAPYVWKRTGAGHTARAEATMPGAYFKAVFRDSKTVGLIVDSTANNGCPTSSMPVVEFCVDDGPLKIVPLTRTIGIYTLPLGDHLETTAQHRLDVCFRAADLTQNRWRASTSHLRIAGLVLDHGGSLLPCPRRPKRAIGFGDSITEGVGVDGLFSSWQSLGVNSARAAWFPIVCAALDCEYGQLGSGGHAMVRPIELPPLPETWDHYDATTSRLTNGLLLPEPDYFFCCMGTNDFDSRTRLPLDITAEYTRWLIAVRKACPHAQVFCVVPPLGWHRAEVKAAVVARNKADDAKVHLIDTAPLQDGFRASGASRLAYDGVHPTVYGNALLGALIAVETQEILDTN